jgi:hypothetical protein
VYPLFFSRNESRGEENILYAFSDTYHVALYAAPRMLPITLVTDAVYSYVQKFGEAPKFLFLPHRFEIILKFQVKRAFQTYNRHFPLLFRKYQVVDIPVLNHNRLPRSVVDHLRQAGYGELLEDHHDSIICLSRSGLPDTGGVLPHQAKPGRMLTCFQAEGMEGFLYGESSLLPIVTMVDVFVQNTLYKKRLITDLYWTDAFEQQFQEEALAVIGAYERHFPVLLNDHSCDLRKIPVRPMTALPDTIHAHLRSMQIDLDTVPSPIIGLLQAPP